MTKRYLSTLNVFNSKGWNLARGLQAGIGCCAPLLLAEWLGLPELSWIGIVAFLIALADPEWPVRTRFLTFAFLTLGIAFGSYLAVIVRPYPWLSATYALIFFTLTVLTRVWSSIAGAIGTLVSIVVLIALGLSKQSTLHSAAITAGMSFVGGLWGLALAFAVGYKRSDVPVFTAVAYVFRSEATFLRDLLSPHLLHQIPGTVREAIERAQAALVAAQRGWGGSRIEIQRLVLMLAAAEGAMSSFLAIRHFLKEGTRKENFPLNALISMANQLDAIADRVMKNPSSLTSLPSLEIKEKGEEPLASALRKSVEWINSATKNLNSPLPTIVLTTPEQHGSYFRQLCENITFASLSFRHALRFGMTAAILTLITKLLHLEYGYWITLSAIIVLQAYPSATWKRAAQRIEGSTVGGIIATASVFFLNGPLEIMLVIFPLSILSMALRGANYALYVLCITPLFILMTELLNQGGILKPELAWMRIFYNILGPSLSLAATTFLWPSWERSFLRKHLAEDIRLNGAFLLLALDPTSNEKMLVSARRKAGLAANNAEASIQRLLDEPKRLASSHISASMTVTAASRQLTEIATAMEHLPLYARHPIHNILSRKLDELVQALTERRPPCEMPGLKIEVQEGDPIAVELKKVVNEMSLLEEAVHILGTEVKMR